MDEQIKNKFKELEERIENLEKIFKLHKEKILNESISSEIFDEDGDKLTLIKYFGDKPEEQTQNISLLVLLGYKEKKRKEKVWASEIKRNVATNGIPIENFSTFMNKLIPRYILRFGKLKSPKTEYKLTVFGESEARKIRRKLLENESNPGD